MTGLARYVPGVALSWPGADATEPVGLHRHVDGTLVFVDVSGFTALSERLAQRGKVGAEQLTDVLNTVFGTMLGLAAARGGTLLKFGGDALFLLFQGDGHPAQAASAAVEMRSALAATAKNPSPAGRLSLRMSVGVHTGLVDLFLVGTSHRELVVTGPATTAVASMEAAASAGQILLSPHTAEMLPASALGEPLGPGTLLRWRRPHADMPEPHLRPSASDPGLFVPTALREFLSAADPESEHRTVGVAFLRYTGLDALLDAGGHQAAADALHQLVTSAQEAADEQSVTFLATDLAEDGGKVILVAGFPTTADDDQGRLTRAACSVVDAAKGDDFPLAVQAGLNRGHVFAGAVGSIERATVTVMGDTVNLAARVMARAEPGTVLATPSVLDAAQTLFATEPVEPFMVKGKSRPVTAYLVGDETGTRPPRGLGTLPFLGRDEELAAISDAIADLASGRGSVLSVVADMGMGKSRLLQEALARHDTVPSVQARAEPYGAATPYRPLRDPLRRLLGVDRADSTEQTEWLSQTVPLFAPDLEPWLPLIGDVLAIPVPETQATRDLDPQFRPDRTSDALVRLMEVLAGGPIVLVLDDAHHADDATAAVLTRFERETESRPWLLLSARREDDSGYQATQGHRIRLEPLDDTAVRSLVLAGTAATPLRPHDIDTIVTRVAGNPLFLEETLRSLRDHGDIDALPSSLEGMVAAQIDALSPLARRVVRRASVLGRSFRVGVLKDLFADEDAALDDATLKELGDILESDGRGRLRFRHALLRDAAYDGLPFQSRRQFHLLAATSTLERAGDRPEEYADNLALHYSMGGDYDRTWHWARVAAEQARQAYANPEAAVQYERALEAARRLDHVPPEDVVGAWQALGDVRGQAGALEASLEAYRAGLRATDQDGDRIRLLTLMASVRDRAGRHQAAHRDLTRAERLASQLPETTRDKAIARVLSVRGLVLFDQERYRQAADHSAQAARVARKVGDELALADSLNTRGTALSMLGEQGSESEESFREALAIHERHGDLAKQSQIIGNLGGMAWFAGDWDEAGRLYRQAAETAFRAGDIVPGALAQANLGELLVAQGRADEAVEVLGSAVATLRASGYTAAAFAETQLGRAYAVLGDRDRASEMLARLAPAWDSTTPTDVIDLVIAIAEGEVDTGRPADALERLDKATAGLGDVGVYGAAVQRVRARALARLGRHTEAAASIATATSQAAMYGLGYETALLTLAAQENARLLGEPFDEAAVDSARSALRELGVIEEHLAKVVGGAVDR